ncbi:PREDICTED: transcription factor bHLH54-like [Camelina sativa]|uniref:Transcription factor bHLH54-like n=2 Tax=Camelina sativa TaxID=90675 RepID=A0ABM0YDB4_CAMSA|nr:PREDICTED: transcription factor bHLH54-like [Camelina sativa]
MDVFVDGELESLLGMFNFDQCSSSKEDRPRDEMLGLASLYNGHIHQHHHQNNVLSSDHHALLLPDMFPFGAMSGGNLPAMLDSWDQNHHIQETSSLKRKLLTVENLCKTNFDCDLTRQEIAKSKKKQRVSSESNTVEESNTNCIDGQSLSNSSDDEKASVTSVKGKTRATKGTATDPQSLYARKRREKINERLKTLQNLVPNGTKVDISTMLEEAVHYVKFLQLQIKLLSSDELWMYAPLAYNGLDMGFHHNLLSRLM